MTARAPIAFFAYNRPEHARLSLESLSRNEGAADSELTIFCDAPRKAGDEAASRRVREVARSRPWCGRVRVVERASNLGCAGSIIDGVTDLCGTHGKVIVVEDDLILSPWFLDYMNAALDAYEDVPRVMQVSGYMFPVTLGLEEDAALLPFTTSWGWATWRRAWAHFDPAISAYDRMARSRALRYKFDLDGSYPFFDILAAQRRGEVDSWALRWYLSTFMLGALTVHPKRSLVRNIGFDGSGVHCSSGTSLYDSEPAARRPRGFPRRIEVDRQSMRVLIDYFRETIGRERRSAGRLREMVYAAVYGFTIGRRI